MVSVPVGLLLSVDGFPLECTLSLLFEDVEDVVEVVVVVVVVEVDGSVRARLAARSVVVFCSAGFSASSILRDYKHGQKNRSGDLLCVKVFV